MDQSLNGRLVKMSQVRCALTWFLAKHERLWVDETEGINDYFSLDGLDRINDDSNGSRCQLFERLLSVDIDGREPAAKPRM